MQRGTTIKHQGSWTLVYFDVRVVKGERKCVPVYKKLARISGEKSPPNSVRVEADKILELINTKQAQPESAALVRDFIEDAYLPWVKANRNHRRTKIARKISTIATTSGADSEIFGCAKPRRFTSRG